MRRPPDAVQTEPRQRPAHVKEAIIVERAFKHLRLEAEAVAEFVYQPVACATPYRMVVVRKNISVALSVHTRCHNAAEHFNALVLGLEPRGGCMLCSS